MKAFVIALMVLSAYCINMENQAWSKREQEILTQISESNWANFIVGYAELHMSTNGALQELLTAVEELIEDLNDELKTVHANFSRRTDVHNRETNQLQQQIEDAQRDIFNASDLIDNVLVPQKDRLENQMSQLLDNIKFNRKCLLEETFQRNKAHEDFLERSTEHTEAIQAIDESLQLLSQLAQPSLLQVERVQYNLGKIQNKLHNHSKFTPLLKALIELATDSNFADQGALQQILKAFNELRVQLVESLNQETADESHEAKEFEERLVQLETELSEFQRSVLIKNAELASNQNKTEETYAYLGERQADLATLQGWLQAENDNYAQETDTYNGLVTQYNKELDATNKAYGLLTQPSFTEYVKSRGSY